MENFHDLLADTLETGIDQFNSRTGHVCRSVVGNQLQYDLRKGFPAVTTKKLYFGAVKGEVVGFFRGYDNAADFRSVGCNIWDANANDPGKPDAPNLWLRSPYRKGTDDLGRIYGVQWTAWSDKRVVLQEDQKLMEAKGYKVIAPLVKADPTEAQFLLMERKINQLEEALTKIITNPSDRRTIVTAWNPGELDMMALPPCHIDYRFVAFEHTRILHVVMTIRSWDLFLGAPFNIASTALILSIMARLAGYEAGTVTIQATNAHIYDNHFEQVREQLSRSHLDQPKLILSDRIQQVTMDEVKGAFNRIQPDDIQLEGYESHAPIKAEMAT